MRSLASVQSETLVVAQISLAVTAADQSTTWQFSHDNISNLSPVNYSIGFAGGVGKASSYNATLLTSLDFIKDNFSNLINADVTLRVDANSHTFYPHAGKLKLCSGTQRT